ncbi:hypothetical protein B0O80DRAFT_300455 [Mortierella sp. GBAus27b]|nr:hypothetical protein BGX31_006932 [Mortierella sp. GBA43]KAI8356850.1 hypothetical protein B0O80DRAFT_300455 [Mortierella sp. GBAus27b]
MPRTSTPAPLYDPEVSLYDTLNVKKDADQASIKKAYYKLALAHHPDKQGPNSTELERDQATARFQRLGFAYAVLGNPERRKVYDETGQVSEDGVPGASGAATWDAYFRDLWSGIVSEETIKEFEKTYRFSDEEKRDVVDAYVTYRGDIDGILSAVPVCSYEDEERFRKIIQSAIDAKVVRKYKAFGGPVVDPKAAARRKRKAEAEAAEAEQLWKELGLERLKKQASTKRKRPSEQDEHQQYNQGDAESELQLMMQANARNREDTLKALMDKYTPKKSKKDAPGSSSSASNQMLYEVPSEDEFKAIQERLMKRKAEASSGISTNGDYKPPKAVGPDRRNRRS